MANGGQTWLPYRVRGWARTFAAVKRCRQKSCGWKPIGSARPVNVDR